MADFKSSAALTLFGFLLAFLTAAPILAQSASPERARAGTVVPQAADNTLGMALMFAVINSDGSIDRGSGVVSSTRNSTGRYSVAFDRDLSGCGTVGSILGPGAVAGFVRAGVPGGVGNTIGVTTNNTAGTEADEFFTIYVFCAK